MLASLQIFFIFGIPGRLGNIAFQSRRGPVPVTGVPGSQIGDFAGGFGVLPLKFVQGIVYQIVVFPLVLGLSQADQRFAAVRRRRNGPGVILYRQIKIPLQIRDVTQVLSGTPTDPGRQRN